MVAFHQANPNPIDRSNVAGRAALVNPESLEEIVNGVAKAVDRSGSGR